MAYYKYVEMKNMSSEDAVILENIHLLLNEKWDYEKVEETKKLIKMFEDSEEVMSKIMSIKELDIRIANRKASTLLTLTEEEKRLGMIEDPEKWIEDLNLRMDKQIGSMHPFGAIAASLQGPDDTSVEMIKALAIFFLKIAVYRFCTVHWPKLVHQDKVIDKKRIKMLKEELEHWEFRFWIDVDDSGIKRDMSEERERLISCYDAEPYADNFFGNRVNSVRGWIKEAYKNSKGKVTYENAKKLRREYCGENIVRKRQNDSSHKGIPEIESMRKLLDIMERHLSNDLNLQDIADLKENMQDWEKNTEKLSEMINNLSGF